MYRTCLAGVCVACVLVIAPTFATEPAGEGEPVKKLVLPGEAFLAAGHRVKP